MRIAWCTPFSRESAIGLVSLMAVEELARREGVEVDVWHPATSAGRTWSGSTRVLTPEDVRELAEYDAVVYHLGDHAGNHLDVWLASLAVPGLVVLHDVALGNLFHGHLLEQGRYPEEFGRWYGPEVRARAAAALGGEPVEAPWLDGGGATHPFLSLATLGARQVLVHSQYAAERAARAVLADITVVGLPVAPPRPADLSLVPPGLPEDVPVVLQAGVLNPNKRIDVVVEAVARLARERPVHLVVAGRAGMEGVLELREHLRTADLVDVTVVEDPDDATLAALRERADLAVVLRQPCLEGASYALLESVAAGLPVVVVEDGSYAEVTGGFVEHVRTPPTPADVAEAMARSLDRDRVASAREARAWVAGGHTAATYADGVLGVLSVGVGSGPRHLLVEQLGGVLRDWGLAELDGAVETVAERVEELFGGTPSVAPVR